VRGVPGRWASPICGRGWACDAILKNGGRKSRFYRIEGGRNVGGVRDLNKSEGVCGEGTS